MITHNEVVTLIGAAGAGVCFFAGWLARGPRAKALDDAFEEGKLVGHDMAGMVPEALCWDHLQAAKDVPRDQAQVADDGFRSGDHAGTLPGAPSPYREPLTPAQRRRDKHKRRGQFAKEVMPDSPDRNAQGRSGQPETAPRPGQDAERGRDRSITGPGCTEPAFIDEWGNWVQGRAGDGALDDCACGYPDDPGSHSPRLCSAPHVCQPVMAAAVKSLPYPELADVQGLAEDWAGRVLYAEADWHLQAASHEQAIDRWLAEGATGTMPRWLLTEEEHAILEEVTA